MKYNCRRCDICGELMGGHDIFYKLKIPYAKYGCPELGMRRYDICIDCFAELAVAVMGRRKEKRNGRAG